MSSKKIQKKTDNSEVISSDSESSNELFQVSQQKTSTRIAELEKELKMLKEKSSNAQIEQITPQKSKKSNKLQNNVATSSKKINKTKDIVAKHEEREEWTSSDPEQVLLIKINLYFYYF